MWCVLYSSAIIEAVNYESWMIIPFGILIAAVCKSNYAQLVTFDDDFARVKGFKTVILK